VAYGDSANRGGVDGTNSSAVISASIGNATTNGGIVHLAPMNITIDSSILHQDRVWLRGSGVHKTIINLADNVDAPVIKNVHTTGNHDMGCRISDLTINGNWLNNNGDAHAIQWEALGSNQYSDTLWVSLYINDVNIWTTQGAGILLNGTGSTDNPIFDVKRVRGSGWGGSSNAYGGLTLDRVSDSFFFDLQFGGTKYSLYLMRGYSNHFSDFYLGGSAMDAVYFEDSHFNIGTNIRIDNWGTGTYAGAERHAITFTGVYGCDGNHFSDIRISTTTNLKYDNQADGIHITATSGGISDRNTFCGVTFQNWTAITNKLRYAINETSGDVTNTIYSGVNVEPLMTTEYYALESSSEIFNALGGLVQNSGMATNSINGTWVTHGLAGTPDVVTLTISGSNYINSTCYLIAPTVIASNSTHFQIGFYIYNADTITAVTATDQRDIYWEAIYKP